MNLVNGLRVTTAAEAILAAARDLGVLDLVILGDSALRLLRIDGTRRIHEYDGARHRETDVHEVDLERDRALLGERWERHGFTSKHLRRDGATIIADADRLLGRAWNPRSAGCRGRACSTTRSSDGPAAPVPTATGGEPLPKPVRCNKETAKIWVVRDRLRQEGRAQALFSRRSRLASFSRGTSVGSTESLTNS
jgi:hypothetical protein